MNRVLVVFATPLAIVIIAQGCAQFSSGDCTDKALCGDDTGTGKDATNDSIIIADQSIDISLDTIVVPDGPFDGCNGGAEDCANGKDDNCNGLIDCEDPVCQGAGYACVQPAPANWTLIAGETQSGTPPTCTGTYATSTAAGFVGINAPAANCGCTCPSGPSGVTCNQMGITYYTDTGCSAMYGGASLPPNNFCVNNGDNTVMSFKASGSPASPGTCSSTPSKSLPSVTWTTGYALCSYNGPSDTGGCTGGQLCRANPTNGTKPCVIQVGDLACPGAPYTQKTLLYTSFTEGRDCTTCTCNPQGASCTGTVGVYNGVGCTTNQVLATDFACHLYTSAISAQVLGSITTNAGTCVPSGGTATGSATPSAPVTLCCPP